MSWLQNTRHSWLLILDNADNADLDLGQFLPAGRKGSILITTRLAECAKYHTAGHPDCYERLSRETATTLLLKACEIDLSLRSAHEDNAHGIVDLLGCHALAVVQAGAAISQGLCNLREYKEMFLTQRRILFACFPKQARSEYGGVYATFEVSATHLASLNDPTGKDALELLSFYASMHFTDFPETAFEEVWMNSRDQTIVSSDLNADGEEDIQKLAPWHVSNLPTFMINGSDDITLHKLRIRKARSLLVSLSLVAFDSDRGTTHMHPVSHFWSRDRLQNHEKSKAGMNGLSVLAISIKKPYARDVDQLYSQLQPHIEVIADSLREMVPPKPKFYFQQSIYRLGCTMYRLRCELALSNFLEMIPVLANDFWIRTANGQNIQTLHCLYMRKFGDASKAVLMLEQVMGAMAKTLATEDPKILVLQHDIAKAYMQVGENDKAVALLENIVKIKAAGPKPQDPDHLSSQHELARAYLRVEENEKAIALFETVVDVEVKKLRPEHPDLLTSQYSLARAYQGIGEMAKATAVLEKVVEVQSRTLRLDHLDRVVSIYTLADCHRSAGNYERALQLARSIEDVAQNRSRDPIADHNAELIGYILKDMKRRDEKKMELEEERLKELRLQEVD